MKKAVTTSKEDCINASQPHAKTEATIEKLKNLLHSCPAAEELQSTWERPKKSSERHSTQSISSSTSDPRLGDLYAVLQSGRSIVRGENHDRGIPMWIIVRMCKASWHRDGSWPLRGSDEVEKEMHKPLNLESKQRVQSIHPSALLIHAEEKTSSDHKNTMQRQLSTKRDGPPIRVEPSADEIAEAYRRRGIFVEEAKDAQMQENEDQW